VEGDQQEETYQLKFQEMQKYIPFLEMMIQRLERSSDKSREAQLIKMKSLLSILSNTKKKYVMFLKYLIIISEVWWW